jgi:ABC-type lipoprotein release transport system permease subunit
MTLFKLALRNLLGAGLRTWLNVIVLSFAYVAIIGMQGLYNGMQKQASDAMIGSEIGGGHYWHPEYDPYDPLTLEDSHGPLPESLQILVENGEAAPVLIVQGTIYPEGRIMPVLLKGIDPGQQVVDIPTSVLAEESDEIPALIGGRMAKSAKLEKGDYVTVRWRDAEGTFDARDVFISEVMKTNVQTIDNAQLWLPLERLRELAGMEDEATVAIIGQGTQPAATSETWLFNSPAVLLKDLTDMVKSKTVGASIMYVMLMFLAMLAIFDTQVLSVFKRRKEIGTLVALGMTRGGVIKLLTLEGAMHGILAVVLATLYGFPLLFMFSKVGWAFPESVEDYGFAIGTTLFPAYTAALVFGTIALVMITVIIVSYLPTRRIAKLNPTDALKGKLT